MFSCKPEAGLENVQCTYMLRDVFYKVNLKNNYFDGFSFIFDNLR